MVLATVTGLDRYRWMVEGETQGRDAFRGQVIEISDEELARGLEMGALTEGDVTGKKKPSGSGTSKKKQRSKKKPSGSGA